MSILGDLFYGIGKVLGFFINMAQAIFGKTFEHINFIRGIIKMDTQRENDIKDYFKFKKRLSKINNEL